MSENAAPPGMKRRDVLKGASVAAPTVLSLAANRRAEAAAPRKMNIILFITDQERAIQHFPDGWAEKHLPGLQRLQQNGLTFERAFCNSNMCSPSRATLLTGLFPAQHQVKDTLTFGMAQSNQEQQLPRNLPNLATTLRRAGYDVVYKGKWHCAKPLSDPQTEAEAELAWRPRDLGVYGFDRWEGPDAGENMALSQYGGGTADNDERFMTGQSGGGVTQEGALGYLRTVTQRSRPFCLVVSLVNPHDVLGYPRDWQDGGYTADWLEGEIALPETVAEDLDTKPTVQRQFRAALLVGLGPLVNDQQKLAYLNFYGNLMKRVDAYLVQMLDLLRDRSLLQNTLIIRTSDHGEMGLAHGGLRQKMFNFYEEATRVPLVYSNPVLYPQARASDALVSHVDLLPTLAAFVGIRGAHDWRGIDYSKLLANPHGAAPQDYLLFTYDDLRAGQDVAQLVPPPNRIVAIRERRYKLARYYDGDGRLPDQWEMYDLENDPLEQDNLARPGYLPTAEQFNQRARLTAKLRHAQQQRLQPLPRALVPKPETAGNPRGTGRPPG